MNNTEIIARTLISDLKRDFQLTDAQAAGVVGNLMHESAGFQTLQEISPAVAGSAGGYGYAQWTGERRRAFEDYTEKAGLDPRSYDANYGFLKHELETNDFERRQFDKVRSAKTADEAASIFSDNYLRPGIPHMASRKANAKIAMEYAARPVPPGEIPEVGTLLDVRQPAAPTAANVAARTNRMLDRVDPMPAAQGTAARTNAMLTRDEQTRSMPLPRGRPQHEAPGLVARQPEATLPVIGPTGGPSLAPTGGTQSGRAAFISDEPAPTAAARPQATPPASAPASNARNWGPDGLGIMPGIKGLDNFREGTGSFAPKPAAAPASAAAPAAITAAPVPKYITTFEKKEVPLGEVAHKGSRDSVAQRAAGEAAAETLKTIDRKVTTLNPAWIEAQSDPKPAIKPATVTAPGAPDERGLGEQIIGGIRSAVGLPAEGLGPGLVGGIRSAVGLPAGGLGPGIMGGIRTAIGIPSDGLGPGIMRGLQRMAPGLGKPLAPLSQQQIAGARANSANHNAAALAAIEQGSKSYTASDGSVQPTTAMNGKVRNTYGD